MPKPCGAGRCTPRAWSWCWSLALLAAVFLSLLVGARPIAPHTVWEALTNFDAANGDHAVVHSRIPRTVAGLLIGAALGLAGAGMQGIARNPLADPGILGVNAGAALAVVLGIHFFAVSTLQGYILFAFAGRLPPRCWSTWSRASAARGPRR